MNRIIKSSLFQELSSEVQLSDNICYNYWVDYKRIRENKGNITATKFLGNRYKKIFLRTRCQIKCSFDGQILKQFGVVILVKIVKSEENPKYSTGL